MGNGDPLDCLASGHLQSLVYPFPRSVASSPLASSGSCPPGSASPSRASWMRTSSTLGEARPRAGAERWQPGADPELTVSCLARSHIFLGFSKCGRYVLSYTSSSGDDDFSFYIYHLYWWEFNVHSKLKLVGWESPVPCLSTGSGADCAWSFGEEASRHTHPFLCSAGPTCRCPWIIGFACVCLSHPVCLEQGSCHVPVLAW